MGLKLQAFAFTSLAHYANDGNSLLYPILITFYIRLPGANISLLAAIAAIFNLVSGFASTPVGRYADKTGKYGPMLSYGIALSGLSTVFFTLPFVFHSYMSLYLILGAVTLGLGQSFYHPLGATVLRNTFNASESPKVMGVNGSFGSLGRAVMPTSVGFMMAFIGEAMGLTIYSAYSFASALLIFLGLRNIKISGKTGNGVASKAEKTNASPFRLSFMTFVYILTSAVFLRALFMTGTATFIPTYLEQEYGSRTLSFTIVLIAYLLPVIGQPVFGALTSRKGGKFSVAITFLLSSIAFGGFLLSGANIALTITLLGLYTFAAYSQFPVLLGYVGQVVPRDHSGTSNAVVWGVGQTIGGAVGAGMVSLLTLFLPLSDSMIFIYVLGLFALFFLPFMPSREKVKAYAVST